MKEVIAIIILCCGLLGCTSKRRVYSEKSAVCADSLSIVRTDSLLLLYRRRAQAGGRLKGQRVIFSEPDSTGRQYIREVTHRTEEWEAVDTSQMIVFGNEGERTQVVQQKTWMEKEVVEKKQLWSGRIGAGLVVVFVIFVFLCIKYFGYGRRTRDGTPYGGSGEEI